MLCQKYLFINTPTPFKYIFIKCYDARENYLLCNRNDFIPRELLQ